jgi:hypothetical protein
MLSLSDLDAVASSPTGTLVANITESVSNTATFYAKGVEGIFGLSGSTIVTLWDPTSPPTAGFYALKLHSLQDGYELSWGEFVLQVTPALTFKEAIMASQITSLTLIEGGASMHVTVGDQNGNPIPPADIAWAAASELTITADATGFNIAAVPRGMATSFSLTATDTAQTPNVSGSLTINITLPPITALTFTSP